MSVAGSGSLGRSGLLVGVASAVANVLGLVFLAVLSRAYAPEGFGEVTALLGLGAIGSVPSIAVQLLIARQVASGRSRESVPSGRAVLALGAILLALVVTLSPVLQPLLHIHSARSLLWLGVVLVPFTAGGGLQGLLLGRERFAGYVAGLLLISGSRLVAGGVALGWHTTVEVTMFVLAVSTVVAAGILAVVVGEWWWWRLPSANRLVPQFRALMTIISGISAFMVLSGLDLLLARHFLVASGSGIYAIGSLFTKAGLWGPQFVAIVVFPRLSSGAGPGLLLRAVATVAAIGAAGVALTALLGVPIVTALAGGAYTAAGDGAWLFAVLGILLALVHLVLLSSIADRSSAASWAIWGGVVAEVALVALVGHGSLVAVLLSATTVTALLAIVGLLWAVRSRVPNQPLASATRLDAA